MQEAKRNHRATEATGRVTEAPSQNDATKTSYTMNKQSKPSTSRIYPQTSPQDQNKTRKNSITQSSPTPKAKWTVLKIKALPSPRTTVLKIKSTLKAHRWQHLHSPPQQQQQQREKNREQGLPHWQAFRVPGNRTFPQWIKLLLPPSIALDHQLRSLPQNYSSPLPCLALPWPRLIASRLPCPKLFVSRLLARFKLAPFLGVRAVSSPSAAGRHRRRRSTTQELLQRRGEKESWNWSCDISRGEEVRERETETEKRRVGVTTERQRGRECFSQMGNDSK